MCPIRSYNKLRTVIRRWTIQSIFGSAYLSESNRSWDLSWCVKFFFHLGIAFNWKLISASSQEFSFSLKKKVTYCFIDTKTLAKFSRHPTDGNVKQLFHQNDSRFCDCWSRFCVGKWVCYDYRKRDSGTSWSEKYCGEKFSTPHG